MNVDRVVIDIPFSVVSMARSQRVGWAEQEGKKLFRNIGRRAVGCSLSNGGDDQFTKREDQYYDLWLNAEEKIQKGPRIH